MSKAWSRESAQFDIFELGFSVRQGGRNEEEGVGVWSLHAAQRVLEVSVGESNLWRRRRDWCQKSLEGEVRLPSGSFST